MNNYISTQNCTGDSRWSTVDELKRSCTKIDLTASHYPTAGVPLIASENTAYVDSLDHHTLVFGSTGSKKTRLFGMPTVNIMIHAGESFITTDPKGEIYRNTASRAKSEGYDIVVLNFRDIGKGDRWNPLTLPYDLYQSGKEDDAILMINDLINALGSAHVTQDPYWSDTAMGAAVAFLAILLEKADQSEMNMASLAAMCTRDSAKKSSILADMMSDTSIAGVNLKSTIASLPPRTLSCVLSTLFSMMRTFNTQKELVNMLSESSFDMHTVGRKKTAVYIIVPDEKTTFHFLVTVFVKQIYEVLIGEAQREPDCRLPVRVNFVLDEFSNIPAIPDMASMISAARSRNIRFFLILQSMHQLCKKYGDEDAEVIKGNCENWIFLASKELTLLHEVSELCGTVYRSNGTQRPLIAYSELQRLSKEKGEALVLHARNHPIITRLMDIGDYTMFHDAEYLEMDDFDTRKTNVFNLSKLLIDINTDRCAPPSPSERYRYKQCKRIRSTALSEAHSYAEDLEEEMGISDPDFDTEQSNRVFSPMSARKRYLRQTGMSDYYDIDELFSNEPPKRQDKKAPMGTTKRLAEFRALVAKNTQECLQKAKEKIAAFYGDEYAELFFTEGHTESYEELDDPYGFDDDDD